MNKFIFPYSIRFQDDDIIELFPAAEITILGKKSQNIKVLFHIDSGATISVLPGSDAEALGINIAAGKEIIIRGISNEIINGYKHSVILQFNNFKLKAPVIFAKDILVPRILGREGVFPHFGIVFHEAKNKVTFLKEKNEQKIINSLFE